MLIAVLFSFGVHKDKRHWLSPNQISVYVFFASLFLNFHKNKTLNVSHNTLCFRWTVKMQIVIVVTVS